MESLLGLSKEQTEDKIVRQRRYRRWFWILGAILLFAQGAIALHLSQTEPAVVASSRTPLTPTSSRVLTNQPTAVSTAVPTATPLGSAEIRATPTAASPTPTSSPTTTPAPAGVHQNSASLERTRAILSTGYGASQTVTPVSTMTSPPVILLEPPDRITEQTFELAGTGQPGRTITVLYNHSIIAQTEIDQKGYWQTGIPTSPLIRGNNSFQVTDNHNVPVSFETTFAPWWLDAPIRLQASLGEGYACAPTVLGMAMDYYHHLDSRYPAPATTELVQGLTRKGFVSGYGADAQMLCDLAIAYGYSHSFFYQEWSQAHLRQMLEAGHPIIANVRVGLSTGGYGHSVLVIGLSPDGKRIMLNDPAQGLIEASWQQFDRSWASFGPPYRHGTVVMP